MRVALIMTTLCVLGSVYAAEPWDMAITVGAAISGAAVVLLLCVRSSRSPGAEATSPPLTTRRT